MCKLRKAYTLKHIKSSLFKNQFLRFYNQSKILVFYILKHIDNKKPQKL